MIGVDRIQPLIGPWMSRQRWAPRGEIDFSSAEITESEQMLAGPPTMWWVLVRASDALYQVIVGVEPADGAPDRGDLPILGTLDDAGGVVVFDALSDQAMVRYLLGVMGVRVADGAHVRHVGAEQSNTSLVADERIIVKFFRRLHRGVNPDVEITTALDDVGFNHLPSPLGTWRRGDYDLAVAQEFLVGGSEGWALAITSLRDLFGAADDDPAAAGGDFASESRRLGDMTAKLHVALAAAFGTGPADVASWTAEMRARADRLQLGGSLGEAVTKVSGAVEALADAGPSTRVHGDYHLGQVIRTDTGWFVLDFEGEPARPLADRRRPSSPLKDVAGMLRSFDYAAAVALDERDPAERSALAGRGRAWERRNRRAFLDGYHAVEGVRALMPAGGALDAVLAFFELDKALYEIAYERAHRPSWAAIPEGAIERLVAGYEYADAQDAQDREGRPD